MGRGPYPPTRRKKSRLRRRWPSTSRRSTLPSSLSRAFSGGSSSFAGPSPEAYAQYYYSARADEDATAVASALAHVISASPDQQLHPQQGFYTSVAAASSAAPAEQHHHPGHGAAAAAAAEEEQGTY
ncbi:hypothetical protein EJB05_38238, partial [Eragrostis curvula]